MIKCNLKFIMATKEISDITALMKISGVSRNSINKLYKEKNLETIKLETLIKICDALDCDLTELVEYTRQANSTEPEEKIFESDGFVTFK